jgi:hypothetical protein
MDSHSYQSSQKINRLEIIHTIMKKYIEQLNRDLNLEFLKLDIKGTNIESLYKYRFELFLLDTYELSTKEKIRAIATGVIMISAVNKPVWSSNCFNTGLLAFQL